MGGWREQGSRKTSYLFPLSFPVSLAAATCRLVFRDSQPCFLREWKSWPEMNPSRMSFLPGDADSAFPILLFFWTAIVPCLIRHGATLLAGIDHYCSRDRCIRLFIKFPPDSWRRLLLQGGKGNLARRMGRSIAVRFWQMVPFNWSKRGN